MSDAATRATLVDPALERRLNRLGLSGKEDEWTDRYLLCEHLLDPPSAAARQCFEAVARFSRDMIAHRWVKTCRWSFSSAGPCTTTSSTWRPIRSAAEECQLLRCKDC